MVEVAEWWQITDISHKNSSGGIFRPNLSSPLRVTCSYPDTSRTRFGGVGTQSPPVGEPPYFHAVGTLRSEAVKGGLVTLKLGDQSPLLSVNARLSPHLRRRVEFEM